MELNKQDNYFISNAFITVVKMYFYLGLKLMSIVFS